LFDQLWETATPFGEADVPHSDISLSKQELAVARLLAQGDTDEGVSRKLGVSLRTTGRLASGIMEKLGARSRFQAGLRVGELGWHLHPVQRPTPLPRGVDRRLAS
jgi:DNA-binding NarL/FixJ family response regulator